MSENRVLKREEVDKSLTWALSDIFADDAAWEKAFEEAQAIPAKIAAFKGTLGDSAEQLYGCLKAEEEASLLLERLHGYASHHANEDMTNTNYQVMNSRMMSLHIQVSGAAAYISSEILAIPEEKLEEFKQSDAADRSFDRTLELIAREREHTRSAEIEALLADTREMSRASSEIFSMFNNADTKFPEVPDGKGGMIELTHGRYVGLLENRDQAVRKAAFEAMYDTFGKHRNTLAATFSNNIKQAKFYAKARKYPSTRAMYLAGSNIPESVYDTLIDTVHEYMPLMYRYVALRKKMLGVDELHMYDLYTPIVPDYEANVSLEEAKETILKALKPMGEEYLSALKNGFESNWIDSVENVGKRSGAYCGSVYGVHPYVLMTYKNTLDNVFTLAHEMGHAMHSWFSNKNQTLSNAHYKIFVAEVASTCNENLLNEYLLNQAQDKQERMYILNHFLDGFKGTVFRQTMFAEFEKIVHSKLESGVPLTADALCKIYHDLNVLYFGEDITVDSGIDMEWARIPHFYTPFYVYQYATGFSAAAALANRILTVGEPAVNDYLKFLSGGGSKDPIDLLIDAGVDMRTKEPIVSAMKTFERYLNELEELLG
ncbi:MAG: oligoendopeptidase F [Lachnospiraceae bacterium]|nr:oligoendopeptidase F [Lachnospiraceae bacterium]